MELQPAIVVLAVGLAVFVTVIGARWVDARLWRRSLVAYRVRLPRDLPLEAVSDALAMLSGSTRRRPVAFEIVATFQGIGHFLLAPSSLAPRLLSTLSAALPGVRLQEAPDYLSGHSGVRRAEELRCGRAWRPLAAGRAATAIKGVLSGLYPLHRGEVVRIQWIFCATRHVRLGRDLPSDVVRDFRDKQAAPLVDACGRIAVSAFHRGRAALLLSGVLSALDVLSTPGATITPRLLPTGMVARRVYLRSLPLLRWPCLFNTNEGAALVGFPVEGLTVPGLTVGSARQLPVPVEMPSHGLLVGSSNYPGMTDRPLTLAVQDRLRHLLIQGPTGVGKSELIANLALQDIRAGYGAVVIDPKSDLIAEILARLPEERIDDVIVMDASATSRPVGFNLLACGRDEHSRELVVDRTVHVLSHLWRAAWGPRTADVMRNSLLTLTCTRAPNGSAFTLAELPDLLTDPVFRGMVTNQPIIPEPVRAFWAVYDRMSDAERVQIIGPTLNKIRAFTTRTALRLMLGQSEGLDLGQIFRQRRILLVPLSKGVIGPDAAHLLGSLLVASLWQEALNRAAIPQRYRRPVFAYLDEFQEFIRFGAESEIADMLSQARSFGLGLTLAFQYLDQLSRDVSAAVLGTVRSQIVFQLEYRDADAMAKRFHPLDRADLCGPDAYEIAMRPCVNARTLDPVTGITSALPEPIHDPALVAAHSLERYGTPRAQIEEARRSRLPLPAIEEEAAYGDTHEEAEDT